MKKGTFSLTIHSADLRRDTETFGKMDPFVLIKFEGQEQRTSVQEEKGKNPVWEQKFTFRANVGDKLELFVMDQDNDADDLIMQAEILVRITQSKEHLQISGFYENSTAGEIMVTIDYKQDGNNNVDDDFEAHYQEQKRLTEEKIEVQRLQQEQKDQERIKNDPKLAELSKILNGLKEELQKVTEEAQGAEEKYQQENEKYNNNVMQQKRLEDEIKTNQEKVEQYKKKIIDIKQKGFSGMIVIQNVELRLKFDQGGFMDKMDPEITIVIGKTVEVLKEKTNAGQHALWKEQRQIKVHESQLIIFQVFDVNVGSNWYLGSAQMSIFKLVGAGPLKEQKINLFQNGINAGTISFDIIFQPSS